MIKTGIVSYGFNLPKRRMKVEEVVNVWQNTPLELVKHGFNIQERGVLGADEDVITLSVEATKNALMRWGGSKCEIDALYLGTCTNPYDSRASSAVIIEALGLEKNVMSSDIQFSTKSGTSALQICQGLTSSGISKNAIAIGADTISRHIAPGDLQEAYAGAGAASIIIGSTDIIAEIEGTLSYVTDLPDSFRIEGERYIRSGMSLGSSKDDIALLEHSIKSTQMLLEKLEHKPSDYQHAVFQQPLGSTAYKIGRKLGFTDQQISTGVYANKIGDIGSASALLGLAKVLDSAKAGDRILVTSYGFGAGSDAISLRVTNMISKVQNQANTVQNALENRFYVNYATAVKYEYKYIRPNYALAAYL